jgi:predicted MFS family arabinose efflux permease
LIYLSNILSLLYRFGRRPILLIGLWGLTISITLFGLSKTFFTLVISRALAGAINGNIAVVKSMMAEMTDETNQAQAFSFLPLVFAGELGVP